VLPAGRRSRDPRAQAAPRPHSQETVVQRAVARRSETLESPGPVSCHPLRHSSPTTAREGYDNCTIQSSWATGT
jgi:integrase